MVIPKYLAKGSMLNQRLLGYGENHLSSIVSLASGTRLSRAIDDANPSSIPRAAEAIQLRPSTTGLVEKAKELNGQLQRNDTMALSPSKKVLSPATTQFISDKNRQDTVAVLQTASAPLDQTTSILQRMRELATQAANGEISDDVTKEFELLKEEVTRIGDTTNFNNYKLLDGSLELVTKTGTNGAKPRTIAIGDMRAEALGIQKASLTSSDEANTALAQVEKALSTVSNQREAINNEIKSLETPDKKPLTIGQGAPSGDRVSDYSSETANLTKAQILQQAGEAMLSQANSLPQQVLSLLK